AGAALAVALGGYPAVFGLLAAIAAVAAVLAAGTVAHPVRGGGTGLRQPGVPSPPPAAAGPDEVGHR
ncbi:MFS transporter, partial [Pseudonocardia sp. NPDC049635]